MLKLLCCFIFFGTFEKFSRFFDKYVLFQKKFNMHYLGVSIFFLKKIILLFRRDVLNGYKVIVKAYIVRKAFYFE